MNSLSPSLVLFPILCAFLKRNIPSEFANANGMKFGSAILLVICAAVMPLAGQAPADLILLNGKIFTSDPARPTVSAIAIRGSRKS